MKNVSQIKVLHSKIEPVIKGVEFFLMCCDQLDPSWKLIVGLKSVEIVVSY